MAGPIVKYHDVANQIDNRCTNFNDVVYGVKRFILGLAKKMLIANTMGAIADKIFTQPVEQFTPEIAWLGAIAYTFQIYYDFSGYSDMAIGLGSLFGFKFLENFNYPYISKSITEFWRRWHISLSTWFKEYLYIPLGGNRCSKTRMYLNLLIVFLATGIWHGAEWTFVLWGLWHGFFIVCEKLTGWHKKQGGKYFSFIQHLYTILIFVFGWVLFRADNISYAGKYMRKMFGFGTVDTVTYYWGYYVDNIEWIVAGVALLAVTPFFSKVFTQNYKNPLTQLGVNFWLLGLLILSVSSMAANTYNPFIYFRF